VSSRGEALKRMWRMGKGLRGQWEGCREQMTSLLLRIDASCRRCQRLGWQSSQVSWRTLCVCKLCVCVCLRARPSVRPSVLQLFHAAFVCARGVLFCSVPVLFCIRGGEPSVLLQHGNKHWHVRSAPEAAPHR